VDHADRLQPWERFELIEARGRQCNYCGILGDRWKAGGRPWHIDHIWPLALGGGGRDWDDLALACEPCNKTKNNVTLDRLPGHLTALMCERPRSAAHAASMLAYRSGWPSAA
jgi:5-methylcytosine-specific restriction endonuclease McrA